MPGRTVILGCRPLDLDLMVQCIWDFGSNLARRLRIGRLGQLGARERGGAVAGALVRGGGSSEEAIPAFPWLIRAEVYLWSMPVARVIHWWPYRGSSSSRTVSGHGAAAEKRRRPVLWHLGWPTVYRCGRKRKRRSGGGLPKLGTGGGVTQMCQRRGRAVVCRRSLDGAQVGGNVVELQAC